MLGNSAVSLFGEIKINQIGFGSSKNVFKSSLDLIWDGSAIIVKGSIKLDDSAKATLVNQGTTAQRDAITAQNGMLYYNTEAHQHQQFSDGEWENIRATQFLSQPYRANTSSQTPPPGIRSFNLE